MKLRDIRIKCGLTQKEAAVFLDIPLRTYSRYENQDNLEGSMKYDAMLAKLSERCFVDENHGVISINEIKETLEKILKEYNVKYAYLFGSYAKNKQNEKSDVDIMISPDVSGLKYFGLLDELRVALHKNVDLINISEATKNMEFLNEILQYGVKIYG